MNKEKKILDVACKAGSILLESGAEIFRVEETIYRIARFYGVSNIGAFIMSSGIIVTAEDEERVLYAKVKHIPLGAAHLQKVAAVNQLSREIEEGKFDLVNAEKRLDEISNMEGKKDITRIIASGIGAACFCYTFGGSLYDSLASFITGVLLYCFVIWTEKRKKVMSKIVVNILGGFFATLIAALLYHSKIGENMDAIIIGAIIPLLPGVSFTNSIRDIANGDYIAGTVRMVDTFLVTFGIVVGVGVVYTFYNKLTGGVLI